MGRQKTSDRDVGAGAPRPNKKCRPLGGILDVYKRQARKIGTFETSILPYEDCCTVFTPRHPKTKPRVEDVAAAEAAMDLSLIHI